MVFQNYQIMARMTSDISSNVEKIEILEAVLKLPAKQHCHSSPFTVLLSCLLQNGPQDFDFFSCHGCQTFVLVKICCYLTALKSWHDLFLRGVLRHLFQCCILIPRKCPRNTSFQHKVPPPPKKRTLTLFLDVPFLPNSTVKEVCLDTRQILLMFISAKLLFCIIEHGLYRLLA